MYPMLNTLPSLPHARLPPFLLVVTELAASNPHLFRPHIPALLAFLPSLLLPVVDAGPTPTVARPNPGGGSSFAFPPAPQGENGDDKAVSGEDDEVRKGALEFMTTLSEARPNMLRGVEGWVNIVVRGCLEGMGEIPEDDLDEWLEADVRRSHFVAETRADTNGSPQKTRQTTRTHTRMSTRSTGSRARWVGARCSRRRSRSSPRCSRATTGGCGTRGSWRSRRSRRVRAR